MGNLCKKTKSSFIKRKEEDETHPKNVYAYTLDGLKKNDSAGQDTHHMFGFETDNTNIKFFGVYDGHGSYGKQASQSLAKLIEEYLKKNRTKIAKFTTRDMVAKNFETQYEIIQGVFAKDKDTMYEKSGSCAISCLIIDKHLYVINVGDSRAVIGSISSESKFAIQMSMDHKPNEADEYKRIINSGGEIQNSKTNSIGPPRIFKSGEYTPGLAVSRSFGDFVAHEVGVIEKPQVSYKILDVQDEFIALGSDGLYDVMSSLEVVGYIFEKLGDGLDKEQIVKDIVNEARKRWVILHKYKESKENTLNEKLMKGNNDEDVNTPGTKTGNEDEKKGLNPSINDVKDPDKDTNTLGKDTTNDDNLDKNVDMAVMQSANTHIDDITCVICFFK